MARNITRSLIVVLSFALILSAISCIKPVKKSAPGPGGMPTGVVPQGQPPAPNPAWPLYAGASRIAVDFYTTTDSIDIVKTYYSDLLKIEPIVRDEAGVVQTYLAPEYTVVLVPMTPSGTEIHFSASEPAGGQQPLQPPGATGQ